MEPGPAHVPEYRMDRVHHVHGKFLGIKALGSVLLRPGEMKGCMLHARPGLGCLTDRIE